MPNLKEISFPNYHEFNKAIDKICEENGLKKPSDRSPYGTYIGNYIVKMNSIKPKNADECKMIINSLLEKEGIALTDRNNKFIWFHDVPCKFYYYGFCLANVKACSSDYLDSFSCKGGHPSNCTMYKNWQNEDLSDNTSYSNTNSSSGGCFIATACYGSYDCKQVLTFRNYRDNFLKNIFVGRLFIKLYYLISPKIAQWLKNRKKISVFIRDNFLERIYNNLKVKY